VVLREARRLLACPDNDFTWSPWSDGTSALSELDGIIARIEVVDMPSRSHVEMLFLPTGPIQEVSVSSGWGQPFVDLASRFDRAVDQAYRKDPFTRLWQLLPSWWKRK